MTPAGTEKDYYKVLGVHPEASEDEIKTAYRTLARQYHPDARVSTNNPNPTPDPEFFKAITEAYALLINTEKRKEYDYALGQVMPNSSSHWLKPKPESSQNISVPDSRLNQSGKAWKAKPPMQDLRDEKIRMILICLLGVFSGIIGALGVYLILKIALRF